MTEQKRPRVLHRGRRGDTENILCALCEVSAPSVYRFFSFVIVWLFYEYT